MNPEIKTLSWVAPLPFTLAVAPAATSTLTSSHYLFPILTQPYIPSRTGVYLTPSLSWRLLIVSVPLLVGG